MAPGFKGLAHATIAKKPAVGRPIPRMPAAQALLLWLNAEDPKLAEKVLRRARELDRSTAAVA